MDKKKIIIELLEKAGIGINGQAPYDMLVHNDKLFESLSLDPELATGETYVEGWWDCQALDQLFCKLFKAKLDTVILSQPKFWQAALYHYCHQLMYSFFNFQTHQKALEVGEKHYDKGNDLFRAMLDKRMVYTCGYWQQASTLDEAQEHKLDLVCRKVDLKPGMKVLDIGCGWGSFAKYAAEKYGVHAVGITISREQLELGQELCKGLDVTLRFQDYRDLLKLNEKYDAIVSIGMFEHVGYKNYSTFMKVVRHCLQPNGLFLLHTIGSNYKTKIATKWINKYIFPNGQIPSMTQIVREFEGRFIMEDWQNIGVHYDKTLMAWHHNFNANWETLKTQYDERFRRMWNFFLLLCAGSFRARENQVWQILLSINGLPQGYVR